MSDVATLGLAIDSSQANAATAALDDFAAAAKPAADAAAALEQAATDAAVSLGTSSNAAKVTADAIDSLSASTSAAVDSAARLEDASNTTAVALAKPQKAVLSLQDQLDQAVGDLNVLGVAIDNGTSKYSEFGDAANHAANAHAGMSTQAMAAMHSIRSMAEEIALGIPPTQILSQQMSHLSFAATGPGGIKGAFTEAIGALSGLINPATLVIGALVGISAAAIITYDNIAATEKQFDSLSDHAMTSVSSLHSLQQAAQIKGIDQTDFLKQIDGFATASAQASENMGSLFTLLHANGDAAGTLQQNLMNVADLVKNASSEAQKYQIVQQAGLPATAQWVQFLSQGSAGITAATNSAVKYGDVADQVFIQKAKAASEAWTSLFSTIENGARSAFINATNGATGFFNAQENLMANLLLKISPQTFLSAKFNAAKYFGQGEQVGPGTDYSDFYKKTGAINSAPGDASKATVNPQTQQQQAQQYAGLVAALGPLASVTQQVTSKQLALNSAANSNPYLNSAAIDKIIAYTKAEALGVTAIQQQTSAQQINAATLTMGVGAAAAYTAEQTRLADFQQRGITLTAQQTAALHDAAQAYGAAAQGAAALRLQIDTQFQTSLLGLDDTEAKVAQSMRQLWGSDWPNYMNSAIADQIRLNDQMGQFKTTGESVLTVIAEDFRDGKNAATVFGNALVTIENQLIKMASNQLISGFLGSISGLGFGGGGGFNPFGSSAAAGAGKGLSNVSAGINHTGYGPGDSMPSRYVHPAYFDNAPRFHTGIGPGERPAIIRTDESVLTPGQMGQLAPVGRMGSNGSVVVNISNAPAGTTATATQSRDGTGSTQINVALERQIDDTSAALVNSGSSAMNSAMERRYGLTPKL